MLTRGNADNDGRSLWFTEPLSKLDMFLIRCVYFGCKLPLYLWGLWVHSLKTSLSLATVASVHSWGEQGLDGENSKLFHYTEPRVSPDCNIYSSASA